MDYNEKDLRKMLKGELVVIASKAGGYDPKTHKTKEALVALILKRDVPLTKKELLLREASKFIDFKKKEHGRSVVALEAFLASKAAPAPTTAAAAAATPVAPTTTAAAAAAAPVALEKLSLSELRKRAKPLGWTKRTGTKKELAAFLREKEKTAVLPEKRLVEKTKVVVAAEELAAEPAMDEWPVSADVLAAHSTTVDSLKRLLKAKGIEAGLPRTKKEILALFEKSRCSFKDFTCGEDEFCDLRNNLCRGLGILRDKDNEIRRLARGLVYFDEDNRRFYGTPAAIAKVKEALSAPPSLPSPQPAQEEKKEEEGVSPISIEKLLDKPSESEIRRAILQCLGLYHDVDPNDEVVLSPL